MKDFSTNGITLVNGDCFDVLNEVPDAKFDLIFADPPYFLSKGGFTCKSGKIASVDKGNWDKPDQVDPQQFNMDWLRVCQTKLTPNGTIWVCATQHNLFSVGHALTFLGYRILNVITWEKPNPPPNLSCRYFTHSNEFLIWASVSPRAKHHFNYADMRKKNNNKQMKTVWQFTAPSKSEKVHGHHPTQKPLALVERCIEASTTPDSFVLDPFSGSGTTALACYNLKRQHFGIEKNLDFFNISVERLKGIKK